MLCLHNSKLCFLLRQTYYTCVISVYFLIQIVSVEGGVGGPVEFPVVLVYKPEPDSVTMLVPVSNNL